jgi:hypothetical protein
MPPNGGGLAVAQRARRPAPIAARRFRSLLYRRKSKVRAVAEDRVACAGKAHEAGGFHRQSAD